MNPLCLSLLHSLILLGLAALSLTGCKTADSTVADTGIITMSEQGTIKNVMFYYLDPANSQKVCAIHCEGEFLATATGSNLLNKCSQQEQVRYTMPRTAFNAVNLKQFAGSMHTAVMAQQFNIIRNELGAVATAKIEHAGDEVSQTTLQQVFGFMQQAGQPVQDASCNLKKAFEKGKPSVVYDRRHRKPKAGFYASLDGTKRFFDEVVPRFNWANKKYRATSLAYATEICEAYHGNGQCVNVGRTFLQVQQVPQNPVPQPTPGYQGNSGICLTGDTLVQMADGSVKEISQIEIGEEVLGYDLETKSVQPTVVIADYQSSRQQQLLRVTIDGQEIVATPTHRFYLPGADTGIDLNTFIMDGHQLAAVDQEGKLERLGISDYEVIVSNEPVYNLFTASRTYLLGNGLVSVSYEDGYVGYELPED